MVTFFWKTFEQSKNLKKAIRGLAIIFLNFFIKVNPLNKIVIGWKMEEKQKNNTKEKRRNPSLAEVTKNTEVAF